MPLPPFANSRALSLGVELELQLVSLSDHDLVSASPDMLMLLRDDPPPGQVAIRRTSLLRTSIGSLPPALT